MKRRTLRRMVLAAVIAAGAAGWLPAQQQEAPSWSPWTFDYILRLWGLDIGVGYRGLTLLPGVQTTLWAYAGGGYEGEHYYRDAGGALLGPGAVGPGGLYSGSNPAFNRIEGAWRLGLEQGFAWNPRTSTNLLAGFFFYRGRYDANEAAGTMLAVPSLAVLPDRDGSILNTLQLGAAFDDVLVTRHKVRDGLSAEASAEWGPSFLLNTLQGNSDFVRFNGLVRWFLPLYDAQPDRPRNVFSVYLGEYLAVDYAAALNGTRVPLYVRQTFGGRDQDTGVGGQVRGVDKAAYDTNLKAVNNLEVRANLWSIPMPDFLSFLVPEIVPGLIVYLDAGAYDQVGEPGISSPASGFVAATGAGPYVEIPGLGMLFLYVEYRLDAANASGDRLTVALELGAQF